MLLAMDDIAHSADFTLFMACLPFTLAQECPHPSDWSNPANFSNDAHDSGGKTMCGIIQREYDQFRRAEWLPVQDVRRITQNEGEEIYYTVYWQPHCTRLPAGLNLSFFDASVNEGSFEAVKILQVALGIANDGEWGPNTNAAAAAIKNVPETIVAYGHRRQQVYRESRGFQYFGIDWIRRAIEIQKQSLAMVAA